mmetsp:Transcript_79654/g.234308  ORF Transcript_79654/g.234308 Transcript_79654/m.234308 type:complete len:209 (-) Transcript_79654:434-1060(-)
MATVPVQQIVITARPLSLQPQDDLIHLALRQGCHVHRNSLPVCVGAVPPGLASEDARTTLMSSTKTPFLSEDLHARMERAGSRGSEEVINELHPGITAHIVNVEGHGLLHGPERQPIPWDASVSQCPGDQLLVHGMICGQAAQGVSNLIRYVWGAVLQEADKQRNALSLENGGLVVRTVARDVQQRPDGNSLRRARHQRPGGPLQDVQ